MTKQDKQEIKKLIQIKKEYLATKNLSKEEKIKKFISSFRGEKNDKETDKRKKQEKSCSYSL